MNLGAVAVAVALLAANAFFVAAEFALLAARRSRMEQLAAGGDRAAAYALSGVRQLSLMLAAAQLGITMASLGLGAVAEPALEHALVDLLGVTALPPGARASLAFVIALAVIVFLHMVVGEMAPKSWAISGPERAARLLSPPFRAFALVTRPAIRLLNFLANGVVRFVGVEPQNELAASHSSADLLMLLEESAEHGHLGRQQHALLSRAIDLSGLDAESAMTPRADLVAVDAGADISELERVARTTGRSRLPVYDGELDRVRGILHVKDLLRAPAEERTDVTAGDLARDALLTPESRALEDLMLDMRSQRQQVAIVVDEYGTVTGLVSFEDVLEELIGEFEDESDRARTPRRLRRRRDGAVLIPATMRPQELSETSGVEVPEGEWETVAGLVIARLGRLPSVGDAVALDGARLEVTKMQGHRVVELALHPET